jgi:hypothetical protein
MKHILTFCFLVIIIPCHAQKVKPSLRLVKGETYFIQSDGTSSITRNLNGAENKISLTLSFKMAFKVTGINDTLYNISASYQSLQMKIKMADTTLDMNSGDHNLLDTPSTIMAEMINKPFNLTLSTKGKIHSVENIDKLIAGALHAFPKIDPAKRQLIKNQFIQSFGANAFKGSLETGVAVFPQAGVAKNDKWAVSAAMAFPAPANVHTVYQLIDIAGDFYQVRGEGIITTDNDPKPVVLNGMLIKYDINGSVLADIKIDKKSGWIGEAKLKRLVAGNIEIMDSPKTPGGKTIPMIYTSEVTIAGK